MPLREPNQCGGRQPRQLSAVVQLPELNQQRPEAPRVIRRTR